MTKIRLTARGRGLFLALGASAAMWAGIVCPWVWS